MKKSVYFEGFNEGYCFLCQENEMGFIEPGHRKLISYLVTQQNSSEDTPVPDMNAEEQ